MTKQSGSAARFAREVLSAVSSDDVLSKIAPPARAIIESKIARMEERLDDAYLLLRVMVALQAATFGVLILLL